MSMSKTIFRELLDKTVGQGSFPSFGLYRAYDVCFGRCNYP